MQLTKNFSKQELECACCGKAPFELDFLTVLQEFRDRAGKALKINSGYRCDNHNRAVGGAANSQHTKAKAVDIAWSGSTMPLLLQVAVEMAKEGKIKGIGLHKHFLHIDTGNRAGTTVWFY